MLCFQLSTRDSLCCFDALQCTSVKLYQLFGMTLEVNKGPEDQGGVFKALHIPQ